MDDYLPIQLSSDLQPINRLPGIGPTRAARIQAILELGNRYVAAPTEGRPQIRTPSDVANLLMVEMGLLEKEKLRVILHSTVCRKYHDSKNREGRSYAKGLGGSSSCCRDLQSTKNYVKRMETLYRGSLNAAVVRICEVFTPAVRGKRPYRSWSKNLPNTTYTHMVILRDSERPLLATDAHGAALIETERRDRRRDLASRAQTPWPAGCLPICATRQICRCCRPGPRSCGGRPRAIGIWPSSCIATAMRCTPIASSMMSTGQIC